MNRAQRKKQLLVRGAVHRAEMAHARLAVQQSLRPGPLLQRTASTAWSLYRNRTAARLLGGGLSGLLPLLGTAAGAVSARGGRWKRGLRAALITAGIAIGIRILARQASSHVANTEESGRTSDSN